MHAVDNNDWTKINFVKKLAIVFRMLAILPIELQSIYLVIPEW